MLSNVREAHRAACTQLTVKCLTQSPNDAEHRDDDGNVVVETSRKPANKQVQDAEGAEDNGDAAEDAASATEHTHKRLKTLKPYSTCRTHR